jgi:hypothetical protein
VLEAEKEKRGLLSIFGKTSVSDDAAKTVILDATFRSAWPAAGSALSKATRAAAAATSAEIDRVVNI